MLTHLQLICSSSSYSLIPTLPDLFNALMNVEKTGEPLDEATTCCNMYYCVRAGKSTSLCTYQCCIACVTPNHIHVHVCHTCDQNQPGSFSSSFSFCALLVRVWEKEPGDKTMNVLTCITLLSLLLKTLLLCHLLLLLLLIVFMNILSLV